MRLVGTLGALWGAAGVTAILVAAIVRLTPIALAGYRETLSAGQWAFAGLFCLFMLYTEGYRGFQLRFSPRTAARIRYLRDEPDGLRSILAPLFAMGFFHANRRTKLVAYLLTIAIVGFVIAVQRIGQPWRGIIDSGVVLGLSWGTLSLAWFTGRALMRREFDVSPETP